MLVIQEIASLLGNMAADMFSYYNVDPYKVFAPKFVHHTVQMIIALLIILTVKHFTRQDFGFSMGDVKTGFRHAGIFTLVFTVYIIIYNVYMHSKIPNIRYAYPLNARNIIGSLAFQLFMSGPSEEILFRALPITMFIIIFKKSIRLKLDISLEVIISALLFALAHMDSLCIDYKICYAFVLGIVYGAAYQKSRSILYPILMHSITNVLAVWAGYLFYFLYR